MPSQLGSFGDKQVSVIELGRHIFVHHKKATEDEKGMQYWGTDKFVDVRRTEPTPAC